MIVILSLLAGLGAGLAQPPYGFWPGVIGYGVLACLIDDALPARPLRSAFWRGWLAGSAYFLIGCWWVVDAFLVDAKSTGWMAPIGLGALAGGVGLFWGLGAMLYRLAAYGGKRRAGPLARALIFAGCFTLSEWLRGHVLTGFPWALPGETWRAGGALSQGAALFGSYGMTWLTLFIAAGLSRLRQPRRGGLAAGAAVAILLALFAYGALRLHAAPVRDATGGPMVRLVQADIGQEIKYSGDAFYRNFQTYLRLTGQPAARRPDVVVWPEGALPYAFDEYLAPDKWTAGQIGEKLAPGQTLLAGGYHYAGDKSFNSLAAITRAPDGGLDHRVVYDKYRLVPFGEYLPAEPLMKALGVTQLVPVGDGFTSGPPPAPVSLPGLPLMQPLICYEDIFPGFTRAGRARTGQGARWILVVSDDAWFGRGAGPRQHLALAAYRAIEEGLPMLRATPTGVSAVIDPYGRVLAHLEPSIQGVIDRVLPEPAALTFYGRYGDALLMVMVLASAIAVATRRRSNLPEKASIGLEAVADSAQGVSR